MTREEIAKKLKAARMLTGLTQKEAAKVKPEDCYEYKCFGEVIGVLNPDWIVG